MMFCKTLLYYVIMCQFTSHSKIELFMLQDIRRCYYKSCSILQMVQLLFASAQMGIISHYIKCYAKNMSGCN